MDLPRRLVPYLAAALLSLLAALGALAVNGITPFGEGTLCWQDNGQQVASDFGYVRGLWEGRHALDWSYACGGAPRSSFHPTFNNLCSPLTWAVAAIPRLSAVAGLSLLFLLHMALLPLGALFYLRRRFPRLAAPLGVALALAYACGGFVLTQHGFLPFLNIALLFPWYAAALDALLRRGRWLPYTLLLAFLFAAGTYFAYMYVLFAALYAAARTGWRWQSPVRQHSLLLVLASAGALALSACSWLPSLLVTASSARAGEAHFWWNATRAELEGTALAYALGLPFLLALLLGARRCGTRYHLALATVLVGLACVSATTLWQLSRPWDFAGRFGYMADFLLLCIAAQGAQRLGRRACWRCRLALPLVWLGGSLMLAASLHLDKAESHRYQASAERIRLAEWAAEQVGTPEGRATTRGHAAVENLAFFTPFDSLSHFTACITAEQQGTPARWGYQEREAVISTEGGTLASDSLLGLRYILSQEADGAPFRVEENPFYFGLGLMVPADAFPPAPEDAPPADPIACQQELLRRLLGAEHAGQRHRARTGEALLLPEGSCSYLQQPEGGSPLGFEGYPYARWGGVENPPRLVPLPAGRPVVVQGRGADAFDYYELPRTSLEALRAYGAALPVRCRYEGRTMHIGCRSTAERPLLFLPLLWQEGYEARVDGAPAPVLPLGGWVGLALPQEGEHRIELRYCPRGKGAGMALSAAALPLLLGAWLLPRRRPALAPAGAPDTLCRRLMLVLALLLLLWPLLSLPVGLLWR